MYQHTQALGAPTEMFCPFEASKYPGLEILEQRPNLIPLLRWQAIYFHIDPLAPWSRLLEDRLPNPRLER